MIGEFADAGLMDGLKKAGAVDILTKILEENPNSLPVLNAVTKTSRKLAQDGDMSAKLMRQNGDVYMVSCIFHVYFSNRARCTKEWSVQLFCCMLFPVKWS